MRPAICGACDVLDLWTAGPKSLTSKERLLAMVSALIHIDRERIEGDVVECGVWRGGNIILARKLSPDRACWLYDTFEGMTMPSAENDGHDLVERYLRNRTSGDPWCSAGIDDVKGIFRVAEVLDETMLRFVAGDVVETLKWSENLPERIALLRLDTDWYASTKAELDVLYPLLVPGGVLIVDDYGHWSGCRKAVDEYFGHDIPFLRIDYTAIALVKPC